MAKIEKMYEEPPPRRSYHWLPIDSQLEAESNSRVTCQEPFTEALLGKPALVHKPRTGLICCRALPSSMRALRPHPVRRIRPQASGAPPPQRVCSPDFILNSGEATKHCADEQVSAEADLSPQTGSVFIYPQCPLARPRLDYDRESGRDWWRAVSNLQWNPPQMAVEHSRPRKLPMPPPSLSPRMHLGSSHFYITEYPSPKPRTQPFDKCNGDNAWKTDSKPYTPENEGLRNETDAPVPATVKNRVSKRNPSWLHTQVEVFRVEVAVHSLRASLCLLRF
uniref:Uncharacterized protein n=1 Tax=Schistocephalus solidus TaxID=70667 RepID=A0A0X3Q2F9_SCHSO